jgi:hypothetical protein
MYLVEWTRSARAELATAWIEGDSTQREAITAATDQIDRAMQASPGEFGESRTGNRRIAFAPPLGLVFSVNEARQRAKVLHVWLI